MEIAGSKFNSTKLRRWVRYIKVRDDCTCYLCGIGPVSTGRVEAHHIIPKSKFPGRAYDLSNGICLCDKCHVPVVHGGSSFDLGHCDRFENMFFAYTETHRKWNDQFQPVVNGLVKLNQARPRIIDLE